MEHARKAINHALVTLFNDILRIEEQELRGKEFSDLSLREMHIIETVCRAGDDNTMSTLALRLHVTTGSLTVAVAALCRKGYLLRQRSDIDRRLIHILLTEKGRQASAHHDAFHEEMTDAIIGCLSREERSVLLKALHSADRYFMQKET